ncbi:4-hydroxy-tetrahydrodipicolinate reductase [Oenococcus sicerae]|uniref:4-hydroxy-tetrahydrodipicolinate reductase n=1 Tax=Oenococcus sicerae TaxID=2203724 RepID=UPI0039ECBD0F
MISIFLAGASGKMGLEIQKLIAEHRDWSLDAVLLHEKPTTQAYDPQVKVFHDLDQIQGNYDIWIDVTRPDAVLKNAIWAIEHKITPIIATSGLTADAIKQLQLLAEHYHVNGIIAPNFSISAVLMMSFSAIAAKFMPDVSIEEIHHPDKLDAPSGTARITAGLLAAAGAQTSHFPKNDGGDKNIVDQLLITSKRQQGYVAYQSVDFRNDNETLTIAQNSLNRKSFMPGVALAIKKARQQQGLIVGLDKVMGLE